jgi:hypothetical protein
MADLHKLDKPGHLNEHNIPMQELEWMTKEQQALAKDRNIMNRKLDWLIDQTVQIQHILVAHDQLLDQVKKWIWLGSVSVGGTTLFSLFLYFVFNHVLGKGSP